MKVLVSVSLYRYFLTQGMAKGIESFLTTEIQKIQAGKEKPLKLTNLPQPGTTCPTNTL